MPQLERRLSSSAAILGPAAMLCEVCRMVCFSESLGKQIYDLALKYVCAWWIRVCSAIQTACFVAGPTAFLDKLIVIQLVEKLPDISGNQKFPRACCWSLSWAVAVQYISTYPTNTLVFSWQILSLCPTPARSRVQKFPAWHTKAAPNGKCCEGYIVPSMVRLMYQLKSVLK